MYIEGPSFRFHAQEMRHAPDEPGVFALWLRGNVVYFGSDPKSIRKGLESHCNRRPLRPKDCPDYFNFEVTESDKAEERVTELIAEFYNATRHLPAGNDPNCLFP